MPYTITEKEMLTARRFLVFIFIFLCPVVSVASGLSGSVDDIAKGMATYFPKTTGRILQVSSEIIEIEMTNGDGLTPGVLLSVYREGDPFYHPVTGVALGHFEEEVALVNVVALERERVIARPLSPTAIVAPGDFVRLTGARIPMGVLPPTRESDKGLTREFMQALEETGRFAPRLLSSPLPLNETDSPSYVAMFETVLDRQDTGPSPVVHVRLENVKTQTVFFDVQVDLSPALESDFMIESLQRLHFEKYPR